MSDQLFVSDLNFRPRLNGVAYLLEAGTPFTSDVFDGNEDGFKQHLEQGTIKPCETPEDDSQEPHQEFPNSVGQQIDRTEPKKPKEAPEGVWNFDKAMLEDLELDDLNAMYLARAAENEIDARPHKDKEALIEKMTAESAPKQED